MADVYKARDHKLNRLVAVKVMKAEFREDTSFVTKFQKEAEAAARLSHPNVVNVFDVGEDRGLYYIVMELIEGITLKNYITRKGKLSVKEATSIAIQVSLGLQAAHHQGIVHRDVKPQNIIISTDGKVKLSDFGIAKATNSNTITANVMGSVHYSSPEQVRGGISDARSDIYSLGITMYEMVTGRVPFDGDTTVSIAIKHLQEEIIPPSRYTPDLPYSLEQIIMKATQKNQNRRYQNVGDLIEDLKRSLLEPQGNFVVMGAAPADGATVRMSDAEMKNIRKNIGNKRNQRPVRRKPEDDRRIRKYEEDEYDAVEPKTSKLERGLTIGMLLIGAIIIGVLIFVIGNMIGIFGAGKGDSGKSAVVSSSSVTGDQVEVPSFVGMTIEEATKEANKIGIGIRRSGSESSSKYPSGQIVSQSIDEGKKVDKNTTVSVVVSKGAGSTTVPGNLQGVSQSEAERAIANAGLKAEIELKSDSSVDVGDVISVSPSEGSSVAAGSTVTIVVSKGENTVTVPSLQGQSESMAKTSLSKLGLKYKTVSGYSENIAEGEVISTSPASGEQVSPGTTVTMTINSKSAKKSTGRYVMDGTLSEPSDYNGGSIRMVLEQNGKSTTIYDGGNPWKNGDYDQKVYSNSSSAGKITIYENGIRKWQYSNVPFKAE
jgi:serine/threonine protein kinase/transcription elongation GreA/GreB family factor